MNPDPEPLRDQLNKIRRAQPGLGRESFAREREDLVGQLVRAPRPGPGRHQPRQSAASNAAAAS